MIKELLESKKLPDILTHNDGRKVTDKSFSERRIEMLDILGREMYGFTPEAPAVYGENVVECDLYCAGEVMRRSVNISFDCERGRYSFPMKVYTPVGKTNVPVFVMIAFPDHIVQNDIPMSEILDRGYALAVIIHDDVSFDGNEGHNGLWNMYDRSAPDSWGTISMWAFACSRALDYLLTLPEIDGSRAAVIGHSRLGKTALVAGARDERFSLTISNDSGCGGAALSRDKVGEQIADIIRRFPYWTCENYIKYSGHPENQPFDQHFLLAAIAPRHLYVASASNDEWADPASEFLSAEAASEAWRLRGLRGLVSCDRLPEAGDVFAEGEVGYHMRRGNHFLTRYDWNLYMDYRDRHNV